MAKRNDFIEKDERQFLKIICTFHNGLSESFTLLFVTQFSNRYYTRKIFTWGAIFK